MLENLLRMLAKSQERFQPILRTKNPKFLLYHLLLNYLKSLPYFFRTLAPFCSLGRHQECQKCPNIVHGIRCPQQVSQHSWLITEFGFCLDVSEPKHGYLMYVYPLGRNVVLMSLMLVILPWTLGYLNLPPLAPSPWPTMNKTWFRMIKNLWHNPIELLVVLFRGLNFIFSMHMIL